MTTSSALMRQTGDEKEINMKNKIDLKNILLGALLATAIVLSVAAVDGRTEWEYKVITGTVLRSPQDKGGLGYNINSQVAEGWQFVSSSGVGEASGFAVLRREKQ